jgi:hypothetical protein
MELTKQHGGRRDNHKRRPDDKRGGPRVPGPGKKLGRPKTMKTYTYRDIVPDTLAATDLRAEAEANPAAAAYRITIYDATGTRAQAETAEALYLPSNGRLGIAWGADATWADVKDVDSGIEMWLNDGAAWERAN